MVCSPENSSSPTNIVEVFTRESQGESKNTYSDSKQGTGYRVQSTGYRVHGPGYRVQGRENRVQSTGYRVQSTGYRVQSTGYLPGLVSKSLCSIMQKLRAKARMKNIYQSRKKKNVDSTCSFKSMLFWKHSHFWRLRWFETEQMNCFLNPQIFRT